MSASHDPTMPHDVVTLLRVLTEIRAHVFAQLPEETAPPRNRLQRIAAMCDLALADFEHVDLSAPSIEIRSSSGNPLQLSPIEALQQLAANTDVLSPADVGAMATSALESVRAGRALVLDVAPTTDQELTCLVCGESNCTREVVALVDSRTGNRSRVWWGLHDRCNVRRAQPWPDSADKARRPP